MPGREYYEGLNLADQLRRMAEHHFDTRTRHLARFEYELLLKAADRLERSRMHIPEPGSEQQRFGVQQSA